MTSKSAFVSQTGPVVISVAGHTISSPARVFSSGNVGWNASLKVEVSKDKVGQYLPLGIAGMTASAEPKAFKSGKSGWYYGQKLSVGGHKCQVGANLVIIEDNGPTVRVQVGINIVVVKSNEWPDVDRGTGELTPTPEMRAFVQDAVKPGSQSAPAPGKKVQTQTALRPTPPVESDCSF
jgi:hypothetical protein